ncbi:MAG TPA: D-glycerate dehydrogenase [Calditrichaeota bacterium]|nr:D-glycerate dehydrogenase [Calditrichota bacterium]
MSTYKILITQKIPDIAIQMLKSKGYKVVYPKDNIPISPEQIKQEIAVIDGLISLLSDTIDRSLLEKADNLKVIANYAAGYNNIDVGFARQKGIIVTNTPDILTNATADLAFALLLSIAKRIVEADQFVRAGKFDGWGPLLMLGADVTGKTLGIIGAGRIGQAVGRRSAGFDMNILYVSPTSKPDFEHSTGADKVDLYTLLAQSDYISIHCPLSDATRHLLNRKNFSRIKKGAYLINTSRGAVVEEAALVDFLRNGHLSGAGLDVYEFEPKISEELLTMKNVILLPHIGSATLETRSKMAELAAKNIIRVLETGRAVTPVI